MGHNLNIKEGEASFASVGKAWHGLGVQLEERMTAEEALKQAKLDYEVLKIPTHTNALRDDDHNLIMGALPTGFYSTVRMDTKQVLGNVGERYTVLQNKDAFKFFDPIVDRDEAIYESAGALGKGETVFLTAKMPEYIGLANGDELEQYVVFINSHDASSAMRAMITPVRVVCQNTLAAAIDRKASQVVIRHTSSIESQLKEASKVLGLASKIAESVKYISDELIKTTVNDKLAKVLMTEFIASPQEMKRLTAGEARQEVLSAQKRNMLEGMNEFYFQGIGQENVIGNAFGVYNGLTGWMQHKKKSKDSSTALKNILFGGGREKALKLVTSLL